MHARDSTIDLISEVSWNCQSFHDSAVTDSDGYNTVVTLFIQRTARNQGNHPVLMSHESDLIMAVT